MLRTTLNFPCTSLNSSFPILELIFDSFNFFVHIPPSCLLIVSPTSIFGSRDFVNEVGRDPTRPEYDSALQLHSNVHVPSVQGGELSDNFDTRNIPTLI